MAVLCKIAEKLYVGFSVILSCISCILKPQMKFFFICQFNSKLGTYI